MRINRRQAALSALGTAVIVAGIGGMINALPAVAADDSQPPTLEENYDYPGGDKTPGIKLLKGNGQILLVGCNEGKTSVEVYRYGATEPFCFHFRKKTGYVKLEVQAAYGIRNHNDYTVDAKVKVNDTEKTVVAPVDDWVGFGTGPGERGGVLLELRAS